MEARLKQWDDLLGPAPTTVARPKTFLSPSLFGAEDVNAAVLAAARAARRARYVRLAAAVADRALRRTGVLQRGAAEVKALRKFRGVAPRVAALSPCALPPILVHVLPPEALRVKRDKYLRKLARDDRKRKEEYAPEEEQGEGGGICMKPHHPKLITILQWK